MYLKSLSRCLDINFNFRLTQLKDSLSELHLGFNKLKEISGCVGNLQNLLMLDLRYALYVTTTWWVDYVWEFCTCWIIPVGFSIHDVLVSPHILKPIVNVIKACCTRHDVFKSVFSVTETMS